MKVRFVKDTDNIFLTDKNYEVIYESDKYKLGQVEKVYKPCVKSVSEGQEIITKKLRHYTMIIEYQRYVL